MIKINKINVWGDPIYSAIDQMQSIMNYKIPPQYGSLMADHHLGYSVPVGGVVAYDKFINISGVGFDIACGNKAVLLDSDTNEIKKNISQIMDVVQNKISFGVGQKNNETVDHEIFDYPIWNEIKFLSEIKDKSVNQLGTVGSGNHYVDIFYDELDRIWVGVHFGSRGLGHTIATYFLKAAGGKSGIYSDPVILEENSDLGEQYIQCMELAGQYAYAGRDWVCKKVSSILNGNIIKEIHNHHNFAWKEQHFGKDFWVIRKGATPAFPGQTGFVGGSMGDISVIIEGKDGDESVESLYSTVHGAGRILGRTEAKGKFKNGKCVREGVIKRSEHEIWIKEKNVEVRGSGLDESPLAYKRIENVLDFHKNTIKILHTLTPIGVCMAGENDFDPYKD